MNVFVLSTGRCGSTTFAEACGHITNYTAAHESERRRASGHGRGRYESLRYPADHIEVDNRLSWFLGALDKIYGRDAFYVHLVRDREEVSTSFLGRWRQRETNIIFSFAWGILTHPYEQTERMSREQRLSIGRQYWDTVNSNIRLFLRDKPHQITLSLDAIKPGFEDFWRRIGAEGSLELALATWDTLYNASTARASAGGSTAESTIPVANRTAEAQPSFCARTPESGSSAGEDGTGDKSREAGRERNQLVQKIHAAITRSLDAMDQVDLAEIQPPLAVGSWTMDDKTLRFLASLAHHLAPAHVVEFGSGLSTRVLAWSCRRLESVRRITSIDHDPEYVAATRDSLGSTPQEADISFLLAPIVARKYGGNTLPAYHLPDDQTARRGKAELIIVDGPPRALGGREGVLYQALRFARPGTLLLLDDAYRKEEQLAISRWQKNLGHCVDIALLPGFPKGLAAITVIDVAPDAAFAPCATASLERRLSSLIEPDLRWIIIDDARLRLETAAGARALPFLERHGEYWGPPATSEQAVEELERLRNAGASHLAIVAPSFWWLEYYQDFAAYLRSTYGCDVHDDELVLYDLRRARK